MSWWRLCRAVLAADAGPVTLEQLTGIPMDLRESAVPVRGNCRLFAVVAFCRAFIWRWSWGIQKRLNMRCVMDWG